MVKQTVGKMRHGKLAGSLGTVVIVLRASGEVGTIVVTGVAA